uniref:Uncharacterized protein n=1 Tax=Physcomitrium patens TaxID=3218 RepID=A0A7I3ZAX2_PHYPA
MAISSESPLLLSMRPPVTLYSEHIHIPVFNVFLVLFLASGVGIRNLVSGCIANKAGIESFSLLTQVCQLRCQHVEHIV